VTEGSRHTRPVAGRDATWLEAGAGIPLVLVHGAGGSADLWDPQLTGLADLARVVAVDLPGHGPRRGGGGQSIVAYADWLGELLDALGAGPAVLVGHSMGGAIAQTVALARPERLAGLVLVATGARLRIMARLLELLRERPGEGVGLIQRLSYAPGTPPERVAVVDRVLREGAPLVTLADYLACDRFDVRPRLGAIRTPTLVVAGTEDRLTPVTYGRGLAEGIAGARLVEIAEAGHFPQLEQPAAVNAAIREFLAGLPRVPAGGLAGTSRRDAGDPPPGPSAVRSWAR
jgi:pimeloyl-ACP methyl ester carboxylesterase